jgi:hypothetical protein
LRPLAIVVAELDTARYARFAAALNDLGLRGYGGHPGDPLVLLVMRRLLVVVLTWSANRIGGVWR